MSAEETSRSETRTPGKVYLIGAAIVAFLVALLLQFSAAGKLLGPNPDLLLTINGEEFKRDHLIAGAEMLVAVVLAFGFRWRYAWSFVALLFAGLLGYSAYAWVENIDCGCFGALWSPPKGTTVAINAVVILASFGLLALGRANKALIALTALFCLAGAGAGYYQARIDRPSQKDVVAQDLDGRTPVEILLETEPLTDARTSNTGETLFYVFVHDRDCVVCEQLKPTIEFEAEGFAEQGAPVDVLMFEVDELEERFGIPKFAWQTTPTVLAIDGGDVVYYETGELVAFPQTLFDAWRMGDPLGGRDPSEDFVR
jgi:hypothetical protein